MSMTPDNQTSAALSQEPSKWLEHALDWVKRGGRAAPYCQLGDKSAPQVLADEIERLRALASRQQGEAVYRRLKPYAWGNPDDRHAVITDNRKKTGGGAGFPDYTLPLYSGPDVGTLYTAPPALPAPALPVAWLDAINSLATASKDYGVAMVQRPGDTDKERVRFFAVRDSLIEAITAAVNAAPALSEGLTEDEKDALDAADSLKNLHPIAWTVYDRQLMKLAAAFRRRLSAPTQPPEETNAPQ